ncbi:hypothetical protein M3Y99_00601900 [Aphelenchoides fujianensis]|nr:hypothetical protein M3Y99_00601900 [Aphelenchoides fujianensis]
MTKRRQAYDKSNSAASSADISARSKANNNNQRPVRTEKLDVAKLNQLIKSIDKTWIIPRPGAREPYKKTCATLYKSRPAACQQVGFGVLCVNYCHEQGEDLTYKCQDISDSTYCRSNSNYESFFAKYRKDSYKIKAFIHQMISRCYATAICNGPGILNTTFSEKPGTAPKSPKENAAPPVSPRTPPAAAKGKANNGAAQSKSHKPSIWERYAAQQPSRPPAAPNAGVIGPPAEGDEFDGQPRYVPFWQRLLKKKGGGGTTTRKTTEAPTTTTVDSVLEGGEELSAEHEQPGEEDPEGAAEEFDVEEEVLVAVATTTTPRTTPSTTTVGRTAAGKRLGAKRRRLKPVRTTPTAATSTSRRTTTTTPAVYEEIDVGGEEVEEELEIEAENTATSKRRHTWKPLPSTTPLPTVGGFHKPAGPFEIVAAASNHEDEGAPPAFWNKFQPGRWFKSIHFFTNTG